MTRCHPLTLSLVNRYASLYFIVGVDPEDNELLALQTIHFYVEVLDRYYGNVRSCRPVCTHQQKASGNHLCLTFEICI